MLRSISNLLKTFLCAAFVLVVFINILSAQTRYDTLNNTGLFSVLSTTGLNMRSQPDLHSKVLVAVPYDEKVEVLNMTRYGRDTLGYKELWRSYDSTTYQIPIAGSWRKVKYKDYIGYMFDAYLSKYYKNSGSYRQEDLSIGLNRDYALLYVGENCFDNFNYNPNWHWYGFYRKDNEYTVKPVEVSFFLSNYSELFPCVTSTEDNNNLNFILGTKKQLSFEHIHNSIEYRKGTITSGNKSVDTLSTAELKKYGLYQQPVYMTNRNQKYIERMEFVLKKNGKQQVLNPKPLQFDADWPFYISWIGDLDGDGEDDYIIGYGDKNGGTILYLSSEADEDQIVKPVAIYRSGYCC
ncbi:MAG: SH3 domain-containing protein [Bacteroidota bacterium]